MKLLTSNTKLAKNTKLGFLSWGIHFSPANKSGYNVCKWASEGCKDACLDFSGMGCFSNVQAARINKTRFFFEHKEECLKQLKREITNAVKLAKKKGLTPSFRLNLTSDLPWEKIKFEGKTMMAHFPDVQFMDYTKGLDRMKSFLESRQPVKSWGSSLRRHVNKWPSNYHLTFSRSEVTKDSTIREITDLGGNVAVVFRKELPKSYLGNKVVDGDISDLRFLDPDGSIVGLASKGLGKKDESGFVVEP